MRPIINIFLVVLLTACYTTSLRSQSLSDLPSYSWKDQQTAIKILNADFLEVTGSTPSETVSVPVPFNNGISELIPAAVKKRLEQGASVPDAILEGYTNAHAAISANPDFNDGIEAQCQEVLKQVIEKLLQ